jgi:hypothetical protein
MQGRACNAGIGDEAARRTGQPVRGLSSGKIRMENAEHPTSIGAGAPEGKIYQPPGRRNAGAVRPEKKARGEIPGPLFDDQFL